MPNLLLFLLKPKEKSYLALESEELFIPKSEENLQRQTCKWEKGRVTMIHGRIIYTLITGWTAHLWRNNSVSHSCVASSALNADREKGKMKISFTFPSGRFEYVMGNKLNLSLLFFFLAAQVFSSPSDSCVFFTNSSFLCNEIIIFLVFS